MVGNVIGDGLFQFSPRTKSIPSKALLGDDPEPALDLVEPGRARRSKVEMLTRMTQKTAVDVRCIMRGVIIEYQRDISSMAYSKFVENVPCSARCFSESFSPLRK